MRVGMREGGWDGGVRVEMREGEVLKCGVEW